ncbi:hypothetical protein ACLB2K_005811 [Fragaria x ananassa]
MNSSLLQQPETSDLNRKSNASLPKAPRQSREPKRLEPSLDFYSTTTSSSSSLQPVALPVPTTTSKIQNPTTKTAMRPVEEVTEEVAEVGGVADEEDGDGDGDKRGADQDELWSLAESPFPAAKRTWCMGSSNLSRVTKATSISRLTAHSKPELVNLQGLFIPPPPTSATSSATPSIGPLSHAPSPSSWSGSESWTWWWGWGGRRAGGRRRRRRWRWRMEWNQCRRSCQGTWSERKHHEEGNNKDLFLVTLRDYSLCLEASHSRHETTSPFSPKLGSMESKHSPNCKFFLVRLPLGLPFPSFLGDLHVFLIPSTPPSTVEKPNSSGFIGKGAKVKIWRIRLPSGVVFSSLPCYTPTTLAGDWNAKTSRICTDLFAFGKKDAREGELGTVRV